MLEPKILWVLWSNEPHLLQRQSSPQQSCDWIDNDRPLKDKICSPKSEYIPKITRLPFAFPSNSILVNDSYDYDEMILIVTEHNNQNKEEDDEYGDEEFDIFDATSPFDIVGRELFMIDS